MEAVQQRTSWGRTKQLLENRSGRTSHEQLGVVFVGSPGFTEETGDVWGVHLAWSGNFRIMCDGISETLKTIHIGELLHPDEVVIEGQESFEAPDVVVSFSSQGLTKASQRFHKYMRSFRTSSPKPVVLNTWEAVYFNHDVETLKELATVAARVGIERFVLDDGWFHGRRNDTAGLGDWWVDESVWPNGLEPLISHVTSLGMDFGLWFEPEMVNPESELYRTQPEWVLDGLLDNPVLGRHQLVLDMSQEEVREYLFEKMNALLRTYDIAYVKWDHNRPLVEGATHHQTRGFYELLSNLKFAHPGVQFESCASGGGRIDMGVAQWAERFWASDSIDALDRLEIQKGLTTFIPPEMLGSHIGSPTCHTTGRKHALSFRAATALFGWLGVEWNLLSLTEREEQQLSDVIDFYKQHRSLIHRGDFFRVDHPDATLDIRGAMSTTQSEGIFSISRVRSGPSNHSAPLRLPVDSKTEYTVSLVHLGSPRWALHRELPHWVQQNEFTMSGAVLANVGLPMPSLLPESTFLLQVEQVVHP
jgi:alpha-galactosidase